MGDAVSLSTINPLSSINLGTSIGKLGSIALVIGIAVVVLGLGAFLVYWRIVRKNYWITIEVSRMIGGHPQRVAIYSAKEVPFGMAGDKLWRVTSAGMWKLKTVKWLPVGKLQSAPRVWKYWIREDGEWINYMDSNIDEVSKQMKVRFVNEDMRLQRLATERLLEQRLLDKTFWERWQTVIMTVILFLVIAVCMILIFFQFSKLLEKFGEITAVQSQTSKVMLKVFGEGYFQSAQNMTTGGVEGLIPA